jgi:glyoxylase-like metal-dependent hydrolase (beta-lactamase superfamily II)
MFGRGAGQYVCTACGYNAIGKRPDCCPFCGAEPKTLVSADAMGRRYQVSERPVADGVMQLRCRPRLGLDHAAYSIDADGGRVWIDCPAAFSSALTPADAILFTHKDFIGAANQYRDQWQAEVWLHESDAELSQVASHSVTHRFNGEFEKFGVRGYPIGGHTPGFTVYIWRDVLFVCDYVYPPGEAMKLNPHGPVQATREGAIRLADRVADEALSTVCGYNYVTRFDAWLSAFNTFI